MEFKELWSFEIVNEVDTETSEETKDEKTGKVNTVVKKEKINQPDRLIFKQPSRREIEAAQEEYAVELSRCVKRGIVTKAMLAKRYRAEGGPLTDEEQDSINELYQKLEGYQGELLELRSVKKYSKKREKEIIESIAELRRGIIEFENSYQVLFQNTADAKADIRAITWYLLNLMYYQKFGSDSKEKLFAQDDLDEQIDAYYDYLDLDGEKELKVIEGLKKALTVASLLYYGGSVDPGDYSDASKLTTEE